jgi:phosphonate transport system substrate-binding protein
MIKKLCAALALGLGMVGAFAQDLNLGIISTDSSSVLKQRWEPLIQDMNKQTGLNVKAFFATDYAGIIEGMRFNKVQVGYFGNASRRSRRWTARKAKCSRRSSMRTAMPVTTRC